MFGERMQGFLMLEAIIALGLALLVTAVFVDQQTATFRQLRQHNAEIEQRNDESNLLAMLRSKLFRGEAVSELTFREARFHCQSSRPSPSDYFQTTTARCTSRRRKRMVSIVEPLS